MHIFKDNYKKYFQSDYSVIPDKFKMKRPAINAWSDYCYKLPTMEERESWVTNFKETNLAVCLGEVSGIIALDLDTVDQRILDIILPILPESPVVKVGAKGETRFFKYTGETTDILKFNGEVVIEILSSNKKTTLPPSIHPSGVAYKWVGKSLLDIDKSSLPILPPALFAHLSSKLKLELPDMVSQSSNKLISGRNDALSSLCGKLIGESVPMDEAIRELIKFDKETNDVPLFDDPEEMRHCEPYSNALMFYSNHLNTINTRRQRENKEYEVPAMQTVVEAEKLKEMRLGKLQKQEKLKNPSRELPPVHTALKTIYSTILSNSWVKQPDLAFGASLALMSTLISRKFTFRGMCSNLYVLNIAPSGAGKDAPQAQVKKMLIDVNAHSLLGAGDYVSDASLMDSLGVKPVRLDVMDEAGGILKNINSGKSDYNGKMADVLAELYTSSNSKYLGRATAEGTKGSCDRPNVNILASTTPTGFSEGISIKAIEKGLMGRFLVFQGDPHKEAKRLTAFPGLDAATKSHLRFLFGYQPADLNTPCIGNIPQACTEIQSTESAELRLDSIFGEFDALRRSTEAHSPLLPIIARLYQQMIKVIMISAASRNANKIPFIDVLDVEFGYKTILYYYDTIQEVIERYIFNNNNEREQMKIVNIIKDNGGTITKRLLTRKTRSMNKRTRDSHLEDLIESGEVLRDTQHVEGSNQQVLVFIGEKE
jgi:hypothetical protein